MSQSTTPSTLEESTVHEANGKHLLLTLSECETIELLNDVEGLRELAVRAAEATGATILNTCVQKFSPQGVTLVLVLAESHASLHTYPEARKVFWDCFTCGTTCDPAKSVSVLAEVFKPGKISSEIHARH